MPRPRLLPLDDALLDAEEASALCKVSRSRWDAYAQRFPALVRGRRLVQVNPDGKVFPCCRGPDELNMGDARTQTFEEIWNGEKYQRFRQQMFDGDYPKPCTDCYVLVGNPWFQRAKQAKPGNGG